MAMHNAELLHKFSPSTCKAVTDMFNDIKDKLSWCENEIILDVGCGTGNVTTNVVTQFIPASSSIMATDISKEMINFATKLYHNPRITFKIMDITDTNLWSVWKKGQFNKIFCFYVMQRIINDRIAYENMFNLLKPGGEILLLFPIYHKLDEISPHLAKMSKYSQYSEELKKMKFHINPREDHISYTSDLLKNLGFDIILCKPKKVVYPLSSIDSFIELFGFTSRLSEILPKNLFDEALEDSKTIVLENKILEETEDGYNVIYKALIVIAKKPY